MIEKYFFDIKYRLSWKFCRNKVIEIVWIVRYEIISDEMNNDIILMFYDFTIDTRPKDK